MPIKSLWGIFIDYFFNFYKHFFKATYFCNMPFVYKYMIHPIWYVVHVVDLQLNLQFQSEKDVCENLMNSRQENC